MKLVTVLKTAMVTVSIIALLLGGTALAKEGKKAEQGWIGITLQDLSPSMAKALQLDSEGGILVNEVIEDSPAAAAGLADGDIIVEFAGKEIADADDLHKAVRKTDPGDTVDLVVIRDGARRTISVELGVREKDHMVALMHSDDALAPYMKWHDKVGSKVWHFKSGGDEHDFSLNRWFGMADHGYLGVQLDDLSEQLGAYFEVEDGEGALITEVIEDSPAAAAGLAAGDVIVAVGDEKVASSAELKEVLADTEADDEVVLTIVRKGSEREITATLGEFPDDLALNIDVDVDLRGLHAFAHPKMLRLRGPHNIEVFGLDEDDLDELRDELKELKMELKELQEEFHNR